MRTEDRISVLFNLPIGALLGVVIASVAQLFLAGGWVVAIFISLGIAGILILVWLFDFFENRVWDAVSRKWGSSEEDQPSRAGKSNLPRYAFAAGLCIGLIASAIWSPAEITKWLQSMRVKVAVPTCLRPALSRKCGLATSRMDSAGWFASLSDA